MTWSQGGAPLGALRGVPSPDLPSRELTRSGTELVPRHSAPSPQHALYTCQVRAAFRNETIFQGDAYAGDKANDILDKRRPGVGEGGGASENRT